MFRFRQPFYFFLFFALGVVVPQAANAQFGPSQALSPDSAYSVFATDLDGDGDADVLSAGSDEIAWYENLGGGSFGAQQVITTAVGVALSVYATDLDGDGDADVLSASLSDGIAWYENLGGGSFGPQEIIRSFNSAFSVYATDLDGDGDADVLSASSAGIYWHENLGASFDPGVQVFYLNGDYDVYAADLDGDGDSDVVSTSLFGVPIAWSENLGSGSFGSAQTIAASAAGPYTVHAADVDGDGDTDVVSDRGWYENLGAGTFGPQQPTGGNAGYSVYAADLDGDGDADILQGATRVFWLENLGGGLFGTQQVIAFSSSEYRSVYAIDLDGDGDADVLWGSRDYGVAWHENVGPPDCNGNGIPDDIDLMNGTDTDCNGNGILDACDISSGDSQDCNGNALPDQCDITSGLELDCNGSGIPDACELADPTRDLNGNGVLDSCESIGSVYCAPAVANSTGGAAEILAFGSNLLFFNDLTLGVRGMPQNVPLMFFNSQSQGFAFPVPSSQGALCVAGLVGRYSQPGQIVLSGSTGSVMFPIDLATIPTPLGFAQAMAGETWNFQAWFRDFNPGSTSNFTDAVSITFH